MDCLVFVLILTTVAAALLLGPIYRRRWRIQFNSRYECIDDEQFLRRCGPGVSRDVGITVRRILAQQLSIDYERVHPEQSLQRDLRCE